MAGDVALSAAIIALAIYGIWSISRDLRQGVASGGGFSFVRDTQPMQYKLLMAFNIFAVSLVCIGAIVQLVSTIGK